MSLILSLIHISSDFWIENADGTTGIREVVSVAQLVKKSAIQKLELSRRY